MSAIPPETMQAYRRKWYAKLKADPVRYAHYRKVQREAAKRRRESARERGAEVDEPAPLNEIVNDYFNAKGGGDANNDG